MTLEPIQMLWVRGELSRMERLSVRSFIAQGHPVHLYSYAPARDLPLGVQIFDAAEIVPEHLAPASPVTPFAKGSMGSFSDYFRYSLLLARGGWWADMDIVAIRPWHFVAGVLTASTEEPGYGRVANTCVMRFPAGHPLMRGCLTEFEKFDVRESNISQTGPLLLHRIMDRLGLASAMVAPSVFCPVPWNAGWQFVRPLWRRFTFDEIKQRIRRPHLSMRFRRHTVAIHLWNETWRAAGLDKNVRYPSSCLYERLQRRWNP
jgi:hypothetical protein